jgi:hypothetical protein
MIMRRCLTIAVALALFGTAGTAFAQSGQGGYLGLNPSKDVGRSAAPIPLAPTNQEARTRDDATTLESSRRGSGLRFISPNDRAYQFNGAPRRGMSSVENTPYLPLESTDH